MSVQAVNPSAALAAQRRLVAALAQRLSAPGAPAEVVETHISFVILAGARVFKLKKPLDLGFLDFSTLERRRFYCEEELRLNRRTAPEFYLAVVAIAGSPEAPELDGAGETIEYAVAMRRFPEARVFERLLAAGALRGEDLDALAAAVAALHRDAARAAPEDAWGSPEEVMAPVRENFTQLRSLVGPEQVAVLDRLEAWSAAEGARLDAHFAARKAAGMVRECHGDLHPGNVVLLDSGPAPFDCIEFNPALRWIDVSADIAFMTMDLGRRGHPGLAARFVDRYTEASGDYAGLHALRFYVVYRALVRAKVAAILASDPDAAAALRARQRAACADYLAYALAQTRPAAPVLILTRGVSGSGKTWLARRAVEALGAVCLRSDVIRKRLHGLDPLARSGAGVGADLYAPGASAATYAALLDQTRDLLAAGISVIADATFLKRPQRAPFLALAAELGVACAILDCHAPEATLRARIAARAADGRDASEADGRVLAWQLGQVEALSAAERACALEVDTESDGPEAALARLAATLGRPSGV